MGNNQLIEEVKARIEKCTNFDCISCDDRRALLAYVAELEGALGAAHKLQVWLITVEGYGSFIFLGDETGAEEMRAHKANWERGVGRKKLLGALGNAVVSDPNGGTMHFCNLTAAALTGGEKGGG